MCQLILTISIYSVYFYLPLNQAVFFFFVRVFYWRTLLDKIELVDDEIPEGMVEGLQEGDTYRNFNAIWVVDKIYTVDDPTLWYKLRIKSHVIKKNPMYKGIGTMDCAYSRGA